MQAVTPGFPAQRGGRRGTLLLAEFRQLLDRRRLLAFNQRLEAGLGHVRDPYRCYSLVAADVVD